MTIIFCTSCDNCIGALEFTYILSFWIPISFASQNTYSDRLLSFNTMCEKAQFHKIDKIVTSTLPKLIEISF